MPRLDIGGVQIDIGDEFLKLTPQAQDAFVKNTIVPSPEFQAAKQKAAAPAEAPQPQGGFWSEMRKAINPVEAAKEMGRTASENLADIESGFGRGGRGDVGDTSPLSPLQGMGKTARVISGAAQLPFALPIGALRNIVGHGMTGLEHLAGTYINPDVAAKDDLQKMYEASRGDVDTALMGLRPAGGAVRLPGMRPSGPYEVPQSRKAYEYVPPPEPPPAPPPTPPEPLSPVQEAIQSQPRALTTNKWWQQQAGQVLSKVPLVGGRLGAAIEAVPETFGEARNLTADRLGNYRTPANVAGDIREHIGGAAEAETQAAELAALRTDEAARANWERTNQAREQAIGGYEAQSARETGAQVGNVPTTDMGQTILDTVRANHDVARNTKDTAYRQAGAIEATVLDEANSNVHSAVNANLRADVPGQGTVDLTGPATSAARSMMRKLREFSRDARNRVAREQEEAISGGGTVEDAAQTGRSMRDVEQLRQDLNFLGTGADNPADRRAVRRIMSAFDDWHGGAVESSLMEGSDPAALPAMQRARAANRDYRERFGYNEGNPAEKTINKMVTGEPGEHIGPNDVAKILHGAPDKAGQLLDSIYQATGDHPNHPNVVQAVRGGFWNNLSGAVEGATPRTPERIASDINKFTRGPQRDVAARIYSPEDQALMQRHADVLRAGVRARENTAALAKTSEPVPTEVPKGPMQELADRVLGRGQKSEEALFDTIEGYAKSKGGGKDISTLARLMGGLPEELRGNFRNTFIRRIGTGLKGDFSPAKFADEWLTKINPQAKAVLFGDGAHVRALDELADASKTFDQVHRRFGNPSGSGHTINFGKIAAVAAAAATGTLIGPVKLLGGWFAGRQFANFLARPAGAASAARFAKQMQKLQSAPTMGNAAAAGLATRNMRNTALAFGIANSIPDQPKQ